MDLDELVFHPWTVQGPRVVPTFVGGSGSYLAANHPCVGDVRGIGGLWTLELVRDRQTREPLVPAGATGPANAPMAAYSKACLERRLVHIVMHNRVHVAPPLNVSDADAASGLAILDKALAEVDTFLA